MNLDDIIRKRYSCRNYRGEKLPRDLVFAIINAARLAPSASNAQPWRFVYIDEEQLLEKIRTEALGGIVANRWFKTCPGLIVLCARTNLLTHTLGARIKDLPYYLIDCGIAGEHIALKACELGVGTCWIGWFCEKKTRELLSIPPGIKIVSLMAIGFPKDAAGEAPARAEKKRYKMNEILSFNGWGF